MDTYLELKLNEGGVLLIVRDNLAQLSDIARQLVHGHLCVATDNCFCNCLIDKEILVLKGALNREISLTASIAVKHDCVTCGLILSRVSRAKKSDTHIPTLTSVWTI